MREIEGAGIVHKTDNEYNNKVVAAIKKARVAKKANEYIDLLRGTKTMENDTLEGLDRGTAEFIMKYQEEEEEER